jgi:hypothetical protein
VRRAGAWPPYTQRNCRTVLRPDRRLLHALAADCNTPQKQVWCAEIVLFTADGLGTNEITRRTAKSMTCVRHWQECFARPASMAACAIRPSHGHFFLRPTRETAD